MTKSLIYVLAALLVLCVVAPAPAAASGKVEIFAGYFFPEEIDEDLTYGLRFGQKMNNNWGWEVAGSWFDIADSQGFSGQAVDADLFHVDGSAVYYPGGVTSASCSASAGSPATSTRRAPPPITRTTPSP